MLLYTTWPDAETAERVAGAAVEAGLAACVNVLAPMRSTYRWDGAVERAGETPALFKTTAARVAALRRLIVAGHPYDTPAVLALPIDEAASHGGFLDWVRQETAEPPSRPDQAADSGQTRDRVRARRPEVRS